jgi:hypothetical protein
MKFTYTNQAGDGVPVDELNRIIARSRLSMHRPVRPPTPRELWGIHG